MKIALLSLGHQERVECWDPRDMATGDEEGDAIKTAIENAALALVLVSMAFLNCRRTKRLDVPMVLQKRKTSGLWVMPVLIRPCPWKTVPWLANMQLHPKSGRALSGGSDHQIDLDLTDLAYDVNKRLP